MKLSFQFANFIVVGLFSAILDIGALFIFIQLGMNPFSAITSAFICGLCINIWLHSRLTFESTLRAENAIRFLFVVGMNYALTLSVILVFQQLGHSYMLCKAVSLPLVALHGFLWSKHWVFRA
jgi:putative flippase GtrA